MSILFFMLLFFLFVYILIPLFYYRGEPISIISENEKEKLLMMKAEVYNSIKDLEYDYHENKISENDYQTARNQLMDQAVTLLKKLESAED